MGRRLSGFDYSRPYFYMVTIKRRKEAQALSNIVAPGRCETNAITRAFVNCVRTFHEGCKAIAPIECFSIMPDHVHLLLRIVPPAAAFSPTSRAPTPLRLEAIVEMLMQALEGRYREVTGTRVLVFEASWHDWIVSRDGQLAAFTRYIRENPKRAWIREAHREHFRKIREVAFLGRTWFGYGNPDLLRLPHLEPMIHSRSIAENTPEWRKAIARAERIGPGGAGVGTFLSPLEKACGHALGLAGGRWVVLSPEGFGERWHPGRAHEPFCADGRMLYLSLYPAMAREPTKAELYARCHEMGALVKSGLAADE